MDRRVLAVLLGVAVLLSGTGAAWAEEVDGDGAASFDERFFEAPPVPSVTIHLDDVALRVFLDALGAQVGQRWELAEGIDARVTVHADDERWTLVLHRTLRPLGLVEDDGFFGSGPKVRPMTARERRHDELQAPELHDEASQRRARIQHGLEARGPENAGVRWVGHYFGSSGFVAAELDVGPDGTFVYQVRGCTGTEHLAWGRLEALGPSRLRVDATFDLSLDGEPLSELVRHPAPGCAVLVREADLVDLGAAWTEACPRGADPRILRPRSPEDPA